MTFHQKKKMGKINKLEEKMVLVGQQYQYYGNISCTYGITNQETHVKIEISK